MVAGDYPETVLITVDKCVPKRQCLIVNRRLKSEERLSKSYLSGRNTFSTDEDYLAE